MITLRLINDFLDTCDYFIGKFNFLTSFFGGLTNLGNTLHDLTFPTMLINVFSITKVFLPTTTIITLFVITCLLTAIALLTGLIYFFLHLGNIV